MQKKVLIFNIWIANHVLQEEADEVRTRNEETPAPAPDGSACRFSPGISSLIHCRVERETPDKRIRPEDLSCAIARQRSIVVRRPQLAPVVRRYSHIISYSSDADSAATAGAGGVAGGAP
jgi:hypothetical protein